MRWLICDHKLIGFSVDNMALAAAFQVIFTFFVSANRLLQVPLNMHIFQLFLLVLASLCKSIEEILVVFAACFVADI